MDNTKCYGLPHLSSPDFFPDSSSNFPPSSYNVVSSSSAALTSSSCCLIKDFASTSVSSSSIDLPLSSFISSSFSCLNSSVVKLSLVKKSNKVVIDTGVFIRLKRIENYAEEFYIPPSVVSEIRDKKAREHIHTFIDMPKILEPTEKDIKFVKYFAKLTGDLPFLSDTDIDIIALTYMLQRLSGDVKNLRTTPLDYHVDNNQHYYEHFTWGPTAYNQNLYSNDHDRNESSNFGDVHNNINENKEENGGVLEENEVGEEKEKKDEQEEKNKETESKCSNDHFSKACKEYEYEKNKEKKEYCDDEGEWITEENINRFNCEVDKAKENLDVNVACMTTDFSIQNVLIQMGINCISIDGMQIMSVKLWGIICRGCLHFSRDTSRLFCEKCGNHTVDKIPITVDKNKQKVILHDNRKKINLRGTTYSIPTCKGGRKDKGLILSEDMLMMQGRDREYRHQLNLWKKQNEQNNPFNLDNLVYDEVWYSRLKDASGKMAIKCKPKIQVGLGRGNPNSNRWQKKNKK